MSTNEWKIKYMDLKQKFLDATDTAYRLGYEQGAKEMQMDMQAQQAQQAMQQAQMAQQSAMGGGQPPVDEQGNPIPEEEMQPGMEGGEEMPPEADPEVSQQLDDHINELESLVAKGEKPTIKDMRKVVENLVTLRKSQKQKWQGKIKKEATVQKKFVDGILAKWAEESKDVTEELADQIKKEGLKLED
jgi:hypothetical protein